MRHLLHVDDEAGVRAALALSLEDEQDISVIGVASPSFAADMLKTTKVDLIVVDLRFANDMSGLEFLKKLRDAGDWTPACVFTGLDQKAFNEKLSAMGQFNCLTYLPKPMTGDVLRDRLIDLMNVVSGKTEATLDGIEAAANDTQTAIAEGEAALDAPELLL